MKIFSCFIFSHFIFALVSYSQPSPKTVEEWRVRAEGGEAIAQFNVATIYDRGLGVSEDATEALRWYVKAARQGHINAQYNLGVMYNLGDGVPRDYAKALKWYHKAAEQGHAEAQYNLGFIYEFGEGVSRHPEHDTFTELDVAFSRDFNEATKEQELKHCASEIIDNSKAVKWYLEAAEQGHREAQYNLAYMYRSGKDLPLLNPKADKWFSKTLGEWKKKDPLLSLMFNPRKELSEIEMNRYRSDFPLVEQVDIETIESEYIKNTKKEGDELWYYRTPEWTWRRMVGRAGYVLIRGDIVVAEILTELN